MTDMNKPRGCPQCRGTGRILLLTGSAPCDACGGTGLVHLALGVAEGVTDSVGNSAAAGPTCCVRNDHDGAGSDIRRHYDAYGRLTSVQDLGPGHVATICCWDGGDDTAGG